MKKNILQRRKKQLLNPKKANIFALGMLLFSVFASFALSFTIVQTSADIEKVQLISIIVQDLIIILLPVLFYCTISRTKLSALIPHERLSGKNMLYIILLTILFSPIITVISSVTTIFYPPDINFELYSYIKELPLPVSLLAMAIMPAVFEELAFRGVILNNYKSVGILKAILVSGLFFGLFHLDFYQIGYAVAAGIFFSFLVVYTNSIYASVFSHFLINGTQVLYTKLIFMISPETVNAALNETVSTNNNYQMIVSGIFFTLITTPFLIITSKKFMEYNKNHRVDFELSIFQENPSEFEIQIDNIGSRKKGFIDIYFILYIIFSVITAILFSLV